ncbi:MAG: hypothetical protein IAF94_11485 [Pirellulaceae bacterium]|nr:hypothetical protein [Pirellulaceae bacterium]
MSTIRVCSATLLVLGMLMGTVCAAAEPQMVTQLHTVLRSETYHCQVGDLVQVRYKTRSAANGISSFNVQGGGDVLRQIAVVMSPLNPADESVQPGSWYFVIAMFKVVKPGDANLKLTPIQNDGEYQRAFQFSVEAQ